MYATGKSQSRDLPWKKPAPFRSVVFIEEIITVKVQLNVFALIYCATHESGELGRYSD